MSRPHNRPLGRIKEVDCASLIADNRAPGRVVDDQRAGRVVDGALAIRLDAHAAQGNGS
jgi:hypothetical protein